MTSLKSFNLFMCGVSVGAGLVHLTMGNFASFTVQMISLITFICLMRLARP